MVFRQIGTQTNLIAEVLGRFATEHLACLAHTLGFRLERLLEVLGVNTCLGSLFPSHLRPLPSAHSHELRFGRASGKGEEPRALGDVRGCTYHQIDRYWGSILYSGPQTVVEKPEPTSKMSIATQGLRAIAETAILNQHDSQRLSDFAPRSEINCNRCLCPLPWFVMRLRNK